MKATSFFFNFLFLFQTLVCANHQVGVHSMAIIGGGPSGLTSALYAARFGIDCILFEGDQPGGQLVYSTQVENYPGYFPSAAGKDLVSLMRSQALEAGAKIESQWVKKIDFSKRPFDIYLASGAVEKARSIILAVGAKPKQLGLASEKTFWGRGVSSCALCDGPLYRDLEVVVVGAGDAAFDEALTLSAIAKKVTILHRSEKVRASFYLQQQVKKRGNVQICLSSIVEEILGDDQRGVVGVKVYHPLEQTHSVIECAGVFIAIGQQPDTEWLGQEIKKDTYGYIILETGTCKTSVAGVFAAGDACDHKYRQAITAAASGCRASIEAREYLNHMDHEVEE